MSVLSMLVWLVVVAVLLLVLSLWWLPSGPHDGRSCVADRVWPALTEAERVVWRDAEQKRAARRAQNLVNADRQTAGQQRAKRWWRWLARSRERPS